MQVFVAPQLRPSMQSSSEPRQESPAAPPWQSEFTHAPDQQPWDGPQGSPRFPDAGGAQTPLVQICEAQSRAPSTHGVPRPPRLQTLLAQSPDKQSSSAAHAAPPPRRAGPPPVGPPSLGVPPTLGAPPSLGAPGQNVMFPIPFALFPECPAG